MEIAVIILLSVLVGFLAKKTEFKIGVTVNHTHKHEYQEIPQTPAPQMTDKELEEQGAGAIDSVIQACNEIMGVTYEQGQESNRNN